VSDHQDLSEEDNWRRHHWVPSLPDRRH